MYPQHHSAAVRLPSIRRKLQFIALASACAMANTIAFAMAPGEARTHPPGAMHSVAGNHTTHSGPQPSQPAAARPAPPAHQALPATAATVAASTSPLNYRRFTFDEPLANWRAVNDTVNAIGGWRAYLKEVQDAQKATSAPATQTSPAAGTGDKLNKEKP